MRFQVTSKLIRPNSWITQTVRQRIPNCWARNGESTSAESAATDARNDELTATGGSQMLATRNRGHRHAVIGKVRRGSPSQATISTVVYKLMEYSKSYNLLVWPFKVISVTGNLFPVQSLEKYCICSLQSSLQWSKLVHKLLFLLLCTNWWSIQSHIIS